MTPSEAMRVTENPKDYTVQERKDAKKVLAKVGSLGQDKTAPLKAKMMRGGMANKKEHMYAAGGMVKDNPGLKALKAASPEAYNKITKS